VDAHATVVAGGIPWNGGEALSYFGSMYHDGARGAFDALALHPYSPTPAKVMVRLQAVRRLMNQVGDDRKQLWITEFGWASAGPPNAYNAGRVQPRYIGQVLDDLARSWRTLNLGGVFYYSWFDLPAARGQDFWGDHMGIYRLNYTPKPVARVVKSAAARLNG
jgi:polysaccharide biosynthesis protein PslG